MPKVELKTAEDRASGFLEGMHPRFNGDETEVILTPDDLTEGKGNFFVVDEEGNPLGFRLGRPPKVTGRYIWAGTHPDKVERQNTIPLLPHETSFIIDGPLVDGDLPPELLLEGTLPKPEKPILNKVKVDQVGFPEATDERPLYLAYTWVRNQKHTPLSPKVKVPPLAQGQFIRLTIPDQIPPGATQIGIWVSHPGQSTASTAGQFRLQTVLNFSAYQGSELELKQYNYSTASPSGTALSSPGAPSVRFITERKKARVGTYYFKITAANELGESLPSAQSGPITVVESPYWGPYEDSDPRYGYGSLKLTRPSLPQDASGWYLYVLQDNQWKRLYHPQTGNGQAKPLPTNWSEISFGGWGASDEIASRDSFVLTSGEPPSENTSAVEAPSTPLDTPVVFGQARPTPGKYYVRVTEEDENGDESPLSDAASVDLAAGEILNVAVGNPTNRLPNATFVARGADGLPLFYSVSSGAGKVSMEAGKLVMSTQGLQTSTTLSVISDPLDIDRTQEWSAGATIEILNPETGTLLGSLEVVLRETSPSQTTDTILATFSTLGEHRYYTVISPSGYPAPSFQADTTDAQVMYRFSGTQKNMIVKISRQKLKDYAYDFRRVGGPEATAPALGNILVEPPPSPVVSPETSTQDAPDRPTSTPDILDTWGFNTFPSNSTQDVSGATLTLVSGKLRAYKSSSGSARAALSKSFSPPQGLTNRDSIGIELTDCEVPTLPSNGTITFAELRSSERFAWLDFDTRSEEAQLEIAVPPYSSGNITTSLDEGGAMTPRNISLTATKEKSALTITQAPTANGNVDVTLGGVTVSIEVTTGVIPQKEVVSLEIRSGATKTGQIDLRLGSPYPNLRNTSFTGISALVQAGDSRETVAQKLRNYSTHPLWPYDHWTISGAGRFVTLTAKYTLPTYDNHTFVSGITGVVGVVSTQVSGNAPGPSDDPSTVASKIRAASFDGFAISGSGATVEFEALEAGVYADLSYDSHSTGATGSTQTTVQGSRDTTEEVAQKVVDAYAGNTYWSVSRSGSIVTFQSLSIGVKQDAVFSPGTTQAVGKMRTSVQGSTDVIVYAKDQYGVTHHRRVLTGLSTSSVFSLSLAIGGAGRDSGVLEVFSADDLRALFEGLELAGSPASSVAVGVTSESSSSLTWDFRIGEVKVLEKPYYRYHDYLGYLLNQVYQTLPPGYKPQDGLYLQDFSMPIVPSLEYTLSVFARWAGFKDADYPFFLYALKPSGERVDIGDLSGEEGIIADGEWQELIGTFTAPEGCFELRMESKGMGSGEIVCQEFVLSAGDTAKRTNLYSLEGSYIAELDLSTPYSPNPSSIGRERRILEVDTISPLGSALDVSYSAKDAEGDFGTPVTDPTSLEQKNIIRVEFNASSDGTTTPVVRKGPLAEYVLLLGSKPIATFLKEDGTELIGGAYFLELEEYAEPPEVVFQRLIGSRVSRIPVYGPVGNQPGYELQVFTPEARKFVEDRMGLVDFKIEAWGKIYTIRHFEQVRFERQLKDIHRGLTYQNHYVAKMPEAEVIYVEEMPA